jgi:hypothetical protein
MTSSRLALTLVLAALVPTGLVACRDSSGGSSTGSSSSGDGGGDGDGGGSSSEGAGAGSSTSGSSGGGPNVGCEGPEATVQQVTTGEIGLDQKVTLKDVVVMSHKFLVSKSKNTGSCLWGVFVSAPGLTETGPNTGLIVLSYGTEASIPEGETQAFCPKLGQEPAGDQIPDDVAPGDVLTVVGTHQVFPNPPSCTGDNPPNQVGMHQLSAVCSAVKTGTAPVPTPHVLTAEEAALITSTDDAAFHDAWGGVKVRVENVGVTPVDGQVLGDFGVVTLANGIPVGDKLYYRPYSPNFCHEGPVFSDPSIVFDRVDGFHYLNFCTWGIEANDKCGDFSPGSEDCEGATTCAPDMLAGG